MNKTATSSTRVERAGLKSRRRASQVALVLNKKEGRVQATRDASRESPGILDVPSGDACCHFWVIDLVHGPTSHGVCKRCDEQRQFSNYLRPSGVLPEKDMSRLSDVPEPAGGDIDKVLQRHGGGYAKANTGVLGYTRRPWAYPRKGRGLASR